MKCACQTCHSPQGAALTPAGLPVVLELLSGRALAVEAADGVAAERLTAPVGLLTFVHVCQGKAMDGQSAQHRSGVQNQTNTQRNINSI